MKAKIIIKSYDAWVGCYRSTDEGRTVIYIFFIPIIGIRISFKNKESHYSSTQVWNVIHEIYPALTFLLICSFWLLMAYFYLKIRD